MILKDVKEFPLLTKGFEIWEFFRMRGIFCPWLLVRLIVTMQPLVVGSVVVFQFRPVSLSRLHGCNVDVYPLPLRSPLSFPASLSFLSPSPSLSPSTFLPPSPAEKQKAGLRFG